jgi:Bacteriocin-protection, YdeI or OmpD-Associated
MSNELGLRNVMFEGTTFRRSSTGSPWTATNWSAASVSTTASGDGLRARTRRESSWPWPSESTDPALGRAPHSLRHHCRRRPPMRRVLGAAPIQACLRANGSYDGRSMSSRVVSGGVVHTVPTDLRRVLIDSPKVLAAWENLTPLARNEWICWVLWPKKAETRSQHIQRLRFELLEGKRRPCCWIGCTHRKDKELSPSVRWMLSRRSKAST